MSKRSIINITLIAIVKICHWNCLTICHWILTFKQQISILKFGRNNIASITASIRVRITQSYLLVTKLVLQYTSSQTTCTQSVVNGVSGQTILSASLLVKKITSYKALNTIRKSCIINITITNLCQLRVTIQTRM